MENIKDEIRKRKKVRKTLLLKINNEIEQISNSKPTLMINSQTIQDIEKKYNKSNILLSEKSIIYSNYIKTETKIFPPNIPKINRIKSVEKTLQKSKLKLDIIGSSYEEDIVSPILNFFPKKIDLASKKLTVADKRYTKNIENIQKLIEENINTDEEDLLNKSTKIENNNLHKLIDKILSIKNNENMEKVIKKNIKKLRKYCYKFKKKKKKNKTHKSREHKANIHITTSKNLNFKIIEKEKDKDNDRKMSNFHPIHHVSSKKQKNFSSVKHKRKIIKLKTLNEDDGKKLIIQLHKVKIPKPVKTSENKTNNNTNDNTITNINTTISNHNKINNTNEENNIKTIINNNNNDNDEDVPYLQDIKKELMRSSINKKPSKFDIRNIEKIKNKNSKKIIKKRIMNRNTSLFFGKEMGKLDFSLKKEKRDKVELHDTLLNKNNKKVKKVEMNKSEKKKNIKIKKLNISAKKKSQKKFIESPLNKNDYYSNCNTYYYTNIFTLTQSTNDKNNNRLNSKKSNY